MTTTPVTVTSTVPGAISTLKAHFADVAAANPTLDVGVFLGPPTVEIPANYLMVGSYPDGVELLTGYTSSFAALPAGAYLKSEDYKLACQLRAWAGNADPLSRIADAFTLLDGVLGALTGDVGGSGALTSSGSWQVTDIENPICGPMGATAGWGLVLTFEVHVFNVRLTGSTP